MSILSEALHGKITFQTAVSQAAVYFGNLVAHPDTVIAAAAGAALSDFKQAASDAVGLADTALGPIIAAGTLAVEAAVNTALASAVGPVVAGRLTPAIDAGIEQIAKGLKAQIDLAANKLRSDLTGAPVPVPVQVAATTQALAASMGLPKP